MSGFERSGKSSVDRASAGTTNALTTPGKRTLTESLEVQETTAAESLAGRGGTETAQLETPSGAGVAVLAGHITAVRAFKTAQGW